MGQDGNQWIMADMQSIRNIRSVTTQGRQDWEHWITAYKLYYGSDSTDMLCIQDASNTNRVFSGNWDRNTKVTHVLPLGTRGRYFKLNPIAWHDGIGLRWGLSEN